MLCLFRPLFYHRRIFILVEHGTTCLHVLQIHYMFLLSHYIPDGRYGVTFQFDNPIGRGLIDVVSRKPHRKPNSFSRWSTEAIHSCLRFMVAISAALNSASKYCLKSFSSIALNFFATAKILLFYDICKYFGKNRSEKCFF